MKKIIIVILFLVLITTISIIGYIAVSADTEVDIEENIIISQNETQQYFKSYGYTLDNPNIIINPYDISPLTALIIFETKTAEKVKITIEGKTKETTYTNEFEATKTHFIPVYGLYPDYINKVKIKCNNLEKIYEIKTTKLPEELTKTINNTSNSLLFVTTDSYPYAIDQNNDVRWYLTKNYTKKITTLSNDHLLLSTDKKNENGYRTGLYEVDFLGKIYKEYQIPEGYCGSYSETNNTLFILSNKLLEIDKQTGTILDEIDIDTTYSTVNTNNNIITLNNSKEELQINKETKETNIKETTTIIEEDKINLNFYTNPKNYKLSLGVSFEKRKETATSNKNIILINYKKPDKNYKKYNITFIKEPSRLVVSGDFNEEDQIYIILEKFIDKKIYSLNSDNTPYYKYINSKGLNGKYSIYLKINDTLYKTNKYVDF